MLTKSTFSLIALSPSSPYQAACIRTCFQTQSFYVHTWWVSPFFTQHCFLRCLSLNLPLYKPLIPQPTEQCQQLGTKGGLGGSEFEPSTLEDLGQGARELLSNSLLSYTILLLSYTDIQNVGNLQIWGRESVGHPMDKDEVKEA